MLSYHGPVDGNPPGRKDPSLNELESELTHARNHLDDIAEQVAKLRAVSASRVVAPPPEPVPVPVAPKPASSPKPASTSPLPPPVASSLKGTQAAIPSPRPSSVSEAAAREATRPRSATGSIAVSVVGVGGGGGNTVSRLATFAGASAGRDMRTVAVNTDAQALAQSKAETTILMRADGLGAQVGRGAGGDPKIGAHAARASSEAIATAVAGSDIVFVTAGMGGGTGSGATPEVARAAKATGALTVGVVTKPFGFEGVRRMGQAEEWMEALTEATDALVVVSNDRLLSHLPPGTSIDDAFSAADDVLRQAIFGIVDIVMDTGLINVDFNDLRAVMEGAGPSLVGIGSSEGSAAEAARNAVQCPLLETAAEDAMGIVFNVRGGHELSLKEVHLAAEAVSEITHPEANIIFGAPATLTAVPSFPGFSSPPFPSPVGRVGSELTPTPLRRQAPPSTSASWTRWR